MKKLKIKKILKSKLWFISLSTLILVVTAILLIIILNSGIKIKEYKNDNYSIKYDNTWKIKNKSNDSLTFMHNTGSLIELSIIEVNSEYGEAEFEVFAANVKYSIEEQNEDYKLVGEKSTLVSANMYLGYKLLYETDDNQASIIIGQKDNRLFIINYTAESKYFDILLDSVENIVSSFKLLEPKLSSTVALQSIETTNIEYSEDSVDCDFNEINEDEIYDNHYNVKYTIPTCFQLTKFDSTMGVYNLSIEDKKISIDTSVVFNNMYNYLTDLSSGLNLNSKINNIKNNKMYTNVVVTNDKISEESYIYKITYDYKSSVSSEYDKSYEEIYLVYLIDYLRTFVVHIEALNTGISKQLVDTINIENAIKYGDYVIINIEDGYINDSLKVFSNLYDLSKKEYYEVTYKVPDKYKELDLKQNKYESRHFGYDYDLELEDYKYSINLSLDNFYTLESYLENINRQYQYSFYSNSSLKYMGELNHNGIIFKYYQGKYTIKSSDVTVHEAYLLTSTSDKGLYKVKISNDENPIPNELINDFISINIEKKEYQK
jgi:hypothetical protein